MKFRKRFRKNPFIMLPHAIELLDLPPEYHTLFPTIDYSPSDLFLDSLTSDIPAVQEVTANGGLPEDKFAEQSPCLPTKPVWEYFSCWCLRNGRPRNTQFWAYCEESQTNFAMFSIVCQQFSITENSAIMVTEDEEYWLVENTLLADSNMIRVPATHDSDIVMQSTCGMLPTTPDNYVFKVTLKNDYTLPLHPKQGDANDVIISSTKICSEKQGNIPLPLRFLLQLNICRRSEGWFKLQTEVYYRNQLLATATSDTFMLNNPRMKKMKEHQLYSTSQLKFMQVYSLHQHLKLITNEDRWISIADNMNIKDVSILMKNANSLFPPVFRYK